MKKLLPLCLSLILALILAIPAAASSAPTAGSTPASSKVAVQVNGKNVTFPNASPEVINGRTMVPMRAVLEALGATVDYDTATKTVTATLGETVLTHVIGTDKIDVKDGEALTMDTTSYVKNGSTLVPLRFFSQALGYEVYWDGGANTAVVIDKASAIAEIDKSFTILNDMQSKTPAITGNMKMDMDMKGEIKLLDGTTDTPVPFSAKFSALYSDKVVNMNGSIDMSAIAGMLEGEADEATAAEMLKDISFQVILGESMWMNMPMLTTVMPVADEAPEGGDIWLKIDGLNMSELTAEAASDMTFGGAVYSAIEYMCADDSADIYAALTTAAGYAKMLVGDDTFTKTDDGYTWKLDETVSAALAQAIGETAESFSLTGDMDLKADGSGSFNVALKSEEITMTLSGTASETSVTVKCAVTMPEVCEVTVDCTAETKASDEAPVTAPPADATVIDVGEMMVTPNVGIIGGADGPTGIFTTEAA